MPTVAADQQSASRGAIPAARRRGRLIGERLSFQIGLILPSVLVLLLFQVVPIFIGTDASFRRWSLYDPDKTWVGLEHYRYVLSDTNFLFTVLPNTFLLIVASVGLSLALGMAVALLLHRGFAAQRLVQTVVLLPLMIGPVIASTMMRWTFNDQFGVVNAFLGWLGLGQPAWLADRWYAFGVIVFTDVWIWTPWFALLLLAGLKSLPKEPFEAAALDAAGRWRIFTHITVPMLRPVIGVCVVIRAIDCFRTFDQVWLLTGGGPARSTEVFSIYVFMEAFQNLNFARGSAAAVIGTLIIMVAGLALYALINRFMDVSR